MENKVNKDKYKHQRPNGVKMFFTHDEADEFKDEYNKALEEHQTSFRYKNEEFNTVYARYILSYMSQHGY